jgi:pimeloyl-ACP methyl ester carboxylesterase
MKSLPLLSVFALVLSAAAVAEPIFDIPAIAETITVDGKDSDWKNAGFLVETMLSDTANARPPANFDPSFRVGWNDEGLLFLVTVRDDSVAESDDPKLLFSKDSVEIFAGVKRGEPEYFQVLTGTGGDGRFPTLRSVMINRRKSAPDGKIEAEVAAVRQPGGYAVEARLPWSNLGIAPKAGDEIALQVCVNDVDGSGPRFTAVWFPNSRTSRDPKAMHRVRLAREASPAVRVAAVVTLDRGQPRIDLTGPATLVATMAGASIGGETIATAKFNSVSGRSRTAFLVPAESVEIRYGAGEKLEVECRDANAGISGGSGSPRITFKPSVFSEEKFPVSEFQQPAAALAAIGECVLTPTFYDAEFNEVTTAAKPGRYGAIVEATTAEGRSFKQFVTLYRTAKKLDWRLSRIGLGTVEFPAEVGLDPVIVAEQKKSVENLFYDYLTWGFTQGNGAAVTFAGLNEIPAGEATRTQYNGPDALNQRWWYELKKRTGNMRSDYYVHLPAGYEREQGKKWPMILFLHGGGERGYDLELVKKQGLPSDLERNPEFPFIVIAPQCSPNEWWSPPELDALLDSVLAKYRIDPERVYLTGLSMGGYGAWSWAIAQPERFSAVVPICGGGDPADAERIRNLPVWAFHGGKDDTVPPRRSEEMVEALRKLDGNVKYTVFPEAGHDSWTQAYAMPELYDWMLQQKKSVTK